MPDRLAPDDSREWLRRARSNLLQAGEPRKGVYLEDLCFQAQQAAEKALKAVLIHLGLSVPHVHDIGVLISKLAKADQPVPEKLHQAVRLTDYAVQSRYPSPAEPVDDQEYDEVVTIARTVITWAEGIVNGS